MQNVQIKPIFRGDKKNFTITVLDKNKIPVVLVDRTFYFTVKKDDIDSYDMSYIKKVILIDNTEEHVNGKFEVVLTSEETRIEPGEYYYDCRFSEVNTPNSIEYTFQGKLVILRTITDTI